MTEKTRLIGKAFNSFEEKDKRDLNRLNRELREASIRVRIREMEKKKLNERKNTLINKSVFRILKENIFFNRRK